MFYVVLVALPLTFCGFVSGCEALVLSGRAACTKPLLAAAADYLEQFKLI
jgi:hypothetical protein